MTSAPPTLIRVITWLPVGGIERRLVAVAPALAARGWNVRVVCLREEGPLAPELRAAGVPVDVLPMNSRLAPWELSRLAGYFRRWKADVVHAHMYRSNVPATLAARWAGVRVCFGQVHNVESWDSPRQALVDRLTCGLRRGTIAVSKAVQRDVMARLREPEHRVPVLYNGIDTERFRPDAALRHATRQALGVGSAAPLVLVPARLHPQKNPAGMIAGFEEAVRRTGRRDAVLAMAGDGKLLEALRAELGSRTPDGRVLLLGKRDDMQALYNAADLVLLSSFKEGFSNAIIEALSTGKPVLASNVGGNAEAVASSKVGWIHPAGDAAALAAQLAEALAKGTEGLAAMAADCRARGEDFSLPVQVEQTDALYRAALAAVPSQGGDG